MAWSMVVPPGHPLFHQVLRGSHEFSPKIFAMPDSARWTIVNREASKRSEHLLTQLVHPDFPSLLSIGVMNGVMKFPIVHPGSQQLRQFAIAEKDELAAWIVAHRDGEW